jgi:hypothetical protein
MIAKNDLEQEGAEKTEFDLILCSLCFLLFNSCFPSVDFAPSRLCVSMLLPVPIQFDSLDAKLAGRNANVPALMRLVAAEVPMHIPLSVYKTPRLSADDAGNFVRRVWRGRRERDDQARAGNQVLIRPLLDDDPA